MKAKQVFETVLYATDLAAGERFYRDVLGLEFIRHSDSAVVLRCGDGVLLLFNPDAARTPGRGVPSHGTQGTGHIAFAMPLNDADAWRAHFQKHSIIIQMEVAWPEGGTSIYVNDPAGNSVEMAPPTLWGGGWKF